MELGQAYKAPCWRNYFYIVLLLVIEFKVGHFFKTPNRTRRDREQDSIAVKPYAGLSGIGSVKSKERKQNDSRHGTKQEQKQERQQMFASECGKAADACEWRRVRGHAKIRDHPPTTLLWLMWEIVFFRPLFSRRKALSNISFFLFFTEQMFLDSKHSIVTLHVTSVLHKRTKYELLYSGSTNTSLLAGT